MKILIVKTSSAGDIVQALPVVEYLHRKVKAEQIDWVVESPCRALIEAHPCIHRALVVDTHKWRRASDIQGFLTFRKELQAVHYDVLFDLQGNLKSGVLSAFAHATAKVGYGRKQVAEWPDLLFTNRKIASPLGLNIREDYLHLPKTFFQDSESFEERGFLYSISAEEAKKIEALLQPLKGTRCILVAPGSSWPNKQANKEALQAFLQQVDRACPCSFLFIWGNAEERRQAEAYQALFSSNSLVVDKLPLPVLQNLMAQVHLVIAMDSLPLHLAATTPTPTFGIFGPSSAKKYAPRGNHHTAAQGHCPHDRHFDKRCPQLRRCPSGGCIHLLTGEALYRTFSETKE